MCYKGPKFQNFEENHLAGKGYRLLLNSNFPLAVHHSRNVRPRLDATQAELPNAARTFARTSPQAIEKADNYLILMIKYVVRSAQGAVHYAESAR